MNRLVLLFLLIIPTSLQAVAQIPPGDSIGYSYYDYLTSGSPTRNLINYGDGQMSFARTAAIDTAHETFGTYYKFYDGASWSSSWEPVDTIQTGFSSIDEIPDAGGVEVIVTSGRVAVDAARGASVWSLGSLPCTSHETPRFAVSHFYIHTVGLDDANQTLNYHRSAGAGVVWDCNLYQVQHEGIVLEPDAFDIDAHEENVAFVVAGTGGDVLIAESTDDGNTWTETVIHDIDETLMTAGEEPADGSCSITYDRHGNAHVSWGSYLSLGDGSYTESMLDSRGNNYEHVFAAWSCNITSWSSVDITKFISDEAGIRYWSEQTGVQEAAWPVDDPTISNPGGRDGNLASQTLWFSMTVT